MDSTYKILVVDDQPVNVQLVGNVLRREKYRVFYAEGGREALALVESESVDLILLDVMMPEMDGYTVLAHLQSDPLLREIPVIILTARDDTESLVRGFNAGAVDYIIKPFITDELLARVRNQLRIVKAKKELEDETAQRLDAEDKVHEYLQRLEMANIELEKNSETLFETTLELSVAKDKLSQTNSELERANATKDRLFSIIGHDLRGPIGGISTAMSLILGSDDPPDINLLREVEKTAKSSYLLLENLLSWARSQRQQITYTPQMLPLAEIADENIELLTSAAKSKNISLVNSVPGNFTLWADRNLLTTVLRNLMANAIKFTPVNGQVAVQVKTSGRIAEVGVADNGVGMSQEGIDKILKGDSFTTYGTANEKGSGLGLLLCNEFARANGGELKIESQPGKGSTFIFTLPLTDPSRNT